ncbi:MAG: LPP20 family lipoprotein [Campylobacterota bacterium]|nr:LPP20 family lipoprotein [Campylobacterota bacterium]
MLNKSLLPLFVIVFFLGCGGTTPTPSTQISKKEPPSWYLNPPQDNAQFMYGVAMEYDRESAIKAALSDMISKLGISIESSFQNTQTVEYSHATKKTMSDIKADISKTKINNYKVIQSERVSYKEFAVLVQTDKKEFTSGLIQSLDNKIDSINRELAVVKSSDVLTRYNTKKSVSQKALKMNSDVLLVAALDKSFKKEPYLKFIDSTHNLFLKAKKSLHFSVSGNKRSSEFVKSIKDYLVKHQFQLSDTINKDTVSIKLLANEKLTQSNAMSIAIITLSINATNSAKRIGGKSLTMKQRNSGDMQRTYQNAAVSLSEEIETQGINEVIGLNLNI